MLNYILIIVGILFSSLASYFSVKVLVRYTYIFAEGLYRRPLLFALLYTGLIDSLTIYLSSVNLAINNQALLGYYFLLYNIASDSATIFGLLILLNKVNKIEVSKTYIFAASLAFTVHLFLILKKSFGLIDTFISFLLFIIISALLLREERKNESIKKLNISTKDFIVFFPFLLISVALIYASSYLISTFLIYLNNLLKNIPLSAYIGNIIETLTQDFIFAIAIIENRERPEEGLFPTLGETILTFTIYVGTVCGIEPIVFPTELLLQTVSTIFVIYISIIVLDLLANGVKLPREIGIILLFLISMLGLLTTV